MDANKCEKENVISLLTDTSEKLTQEGIQVCERILTHLQELEAEQRNRLEKIMPRENFTKMSEEILVGVKHIQKKITLSKNRKLQALLSRKTILNIINPVPNCNDGVVPMLPDGNCFYRCISYKIFGEQNFHSEIRKNVAQELNQNKNFYREFVEGSYDTYLENMKKSDGSVDSWASEIEIIAAAFSYNIDNL